MTTLERVHPYVEQLFDDSEVHEHLERAAANLRAARSQAKRKKGPRSAVTDRKLRTRVLRSLSAAAAAAVALQEAPEKQRRRSRRVRLLALAAGAAVGYLAYDESLRGKLMAALGAKEATAHE